MAAAINILVNLEDVLLSADDLPWEYALYIPEVNGEWSKEMKVMVLDPEETEDPDEVPNEAKGNALKYALTISEAQGVLENARQQKSKLSGGLLVLALKYYYENDAFIVFG